MRSRIPCLVTLTVALACSGGGGDSKTAATPTSPTTPATPAAPAPVATVVLSPPSAQLLVNGTQLLTVTLRDAQGNALTGRTVTWTSASTAVATVSVNGLVTAVSPGSAAISASSEGASSSVTIAIFSPTDIPTFNRPFAGEFPLGNFMDHDVPLEGVDANGVFVSFWGESHANTGGMVDGHSGFDFLMSIGTPLVAVAAGKVTTAGNLAPFFCPFTNSIVNDAAVVQIEHQLPGGIVIRSHYGHLSRIDVTVGQQVVQGQQVALSGNSGCSTAAHVHFETLRVSNTKTGQPTSMDPWGWTGAGSDPWEVAANGTQSIQLWKAGQAPQLVRQLTFPMPAAPAAPFVITKVAYEGVNDAATPNNEYVDIALDSRVAQSMSLDGWRLKGDKTLTNYLFSGVTLTVANPTLRVYSGAGANTASVVFLGRTSGAWSDVKDDCVRLVNPAGGQIRINMGNGCPLPGP